MERPRNPRYDLAEWFVQEILGEPFDKDLHRIVLRQANDLLRRTNGLTKEQVQTTILRMRAAGERVTSLYAVFNRDRLTGQVFLAGIAFPPPIPQSATPKYDDWVRDWGKQAISRGTWDGIYRGWNGHSRTPEHGAIGQQELLNILGKDLFQASLDAYRDFLNRWGRRTAPPIQRKTRW